MPEELKIQLRLKLQQTLKQWCENIKTDKSVDSEPLGELPADLSAHMAAAALHVLLASASGQDALRLTLDISDD